MWVLAALIVGVVGDNRTIGFWVSFLLSIILSPVIGLIIVLFSKTNTQAAIEQGMLNQLNKANRPSHEEVQIKLERIEEMKNKNLITDNEYKLMRSEVMKSVI